MPRDPEIIHTATTLLERRSSGEPIVAWRDRPPAERYQVLAEQGRGGIGRVLRAHDTELGRDVAIKELLRRGGIPEARFLRETRITARLEHPSIVPVYDAGQRDDGTPFYAMKLVSGRPLDELIAAANTLDQKLRLLPHIISVADALAYAHARGVIHRDLKPAHVIIGEFGEAIVIDWGLAKDLRSEPEASDHEGIYRTSADVFLTAIGSVMGTPAYMSPEQAQGQEVDERADVYAIGAILYHILSGRPPYLGHESDEVLDQLRGAPPPALIDLVPRGAGVAFELITIANKAMSRDLGDRYRTAKELAEDLRRFQAGQFVGAHVYTPLEIVRRWLVRHRGYVAVAAVALLAISASVVLSFQSIVTERNHATVARDDANQQRELVQSQRNRLILAQARSALQLDPTNAVAWLKQYPATGSDWTQVLDIASRARWLGIARRVLRGHRGTVLTVGFSPTSEHVASGSNDGTIRVWNLRDGQVLVLDKDVGNRRQFLFSADGKWILHEGANGDVWKTSLLSRRSTALPAHGGPLLVFVASPNNRYAVSSGRDGKVLFWDLSSMTSSVLRHGKSPIVKLAVSSDHRWVAGCTDDEMLYIWRVSTRDERRLGPCENSDIEAMAFAPNSKWFATANARGPVSVWNTETLEGHVLTGHQGPVLSLAFSRDGAFLVTASLDKTSRVWDSATGQQVWTLPMKGRGRGARFAPSGHLLATSDDDGAIYWAELDRGTQRAWVAHGGAVDAPIAFSPDGRLIASVDSRQNIRVWEVPATWPQTYRGHHHAIHHVAWSPDGERLATDSLDHTVRVWSRWGDRLRVLSGHRDLVYGLHFMSNDELVSTSWDGTCLSWNIDTGASTTLMDHLGVVWASAVDPASRAVAAGGVDKIVNVAIDGRIVSLRGHDGTIRALRFLGDSRHVVSASEDGTVRVWNLEQTRARVLRGNARSFTSMDVSPDSRRVLAGGLDGSVVLWDLDGPGVPTELGRHDGRVMKVQFSPSGGKLLSTGRDNALHILDLRSRSERRLNGYDVYFNSATFSPDEKHVAVGSVGGHVGLYELATGKLVLVAGQDSDVLDVEFSPRGDRLASSSMGGEMQVWEVSDLETSLVPAGPAELRRWLNDATNLNAEESM